MSAKNLVRSPNRIVALFPALGGTGGIQEAGRITAAALHEIASKHGWSTDHLSLNDPRGIQTLSTANDPVFFLGFDRGKVLFALSALARARGETRIVIVAHPYLALPAAQMKLLRPGLKIVVIAHGIEVWNRLPWVRRRALFAADFFMAPSRYTIEEMIKVQGVARSQARRIAWPLSPSVLQLAEQRSEPLPLPHGFPSGLVILAVARLVASENYKGVDQLIRATALLRSKLPCLHLVIVGGGDDLPRHRRLAVEAGLESHAHFFEGLSQAQIAACYSRSDVFALPSTGEGFGLVFLEAMAFAKPVVGVAAGGVTDIIENGVNGLLVPPADLRQLTGALESLLTNESLRARLGHRGAEIVRSKFQFSTFRSELEELLHECGLASY